jgi:hypothetical protein
MVPSTSSQTALALIDSGAGKHVVAPGHFDPEEADLLMLGSTQPGTGHAWHKCFTNSLDLIN